MRSVFTRGWIVVFLLCVAGCQDCRDPANGEPFPFDEPDAAADVRIALDSTIRDVADLPPALDIATDDLPTRDADMAPEVTCDMPFQAEPPMRNGEVRRNYVCDDGVLYSFVPFGDEQGCQGEPTHFNGFRFYPYSPGAMFAAEDGCSVCVCGFDEELECVSACDVETCSFGGEQRAVGEAFLSEDGRSVCVCRGDGEVECSGALNGAVGCVVDGQRLQTGAPAPTPPEECGPCWCDTRGISCIEFPNCDGCWSIDDTEQPFGATVTSPDCGTCTCGTDHLWSCDQTCEMSATCEVGVTTVPNWTFWDLSANRYDCYGGSIGNTSVGSKLCYELNRGRAAEVGEIVYSTDGCTACLCGGFDDPNMVCVDTCTPACTMGERSFGAGEVFRADDGCNACICGGDGTIRCTAQTCLSTMCEGGRHPGETWFVDEELPALCRCLPDGQTECTTERRCSDQVGGQCLPAEKCIDYRCR